MSLLTVRVFSVLADRVGSREIDVEIELPATGRQLLKHLAEHFAAVDEMLSVIRLAVNHEYVEPDHIIESQDEVALITPTSGG